MVQRRYERRMIGRVSRQIVSECTERSVFGKVVRVGKVIAVIGFLLFVTAALIGDWKTGFIDDVVTGELWNGFWSNVLGYLGTFIEGTGELGTLAVVLLVIGLVMTIGLGSVLHLRTLVMGRRLAEAIESDHLSVAEAIELRQDMAYQDTPLRVVMEARSPRMAVPRFTRR